MSKYCLITDRTAEFMHLETFWQIRSGILITDVCRKIHETGNSVFVAIDPYLFQETHGINEIPTGYSDLVLREEHNSTLTNIFISTIGLQMREMEYDAYRCEFVLENFTTCEGTAKISDVGE